MKYAFIRAHREEFGVRHDVPPASGPFLRFLRMGAPQPAAPSNARPAFCHKGLMPRHRHGFGQAGAPPQRFDRPAMVFNRLSAFMA